jgi:hypothetical protein
MSDINAARVKEVAAFFESTATTVSENPDAIEKGLYFMCVETAAMLRALGTERDALRAEIEKLRAALQTARRDALGECISICNAVAHANRVEYPAKWKDRPEGIPHDWQQAWETCAETAEDIAATIRALGEKE